MTVNSKNKPETFFLVGGGTGGHVVPALALAAVLQNKRPQAKICFVGTRRGIEADIVPQKGYTIFFVTVRGVARGSIFKNILVPFLLVQSLVQCVVLLLKHRPRAVVGTGGYVSGPMLYMASVLRIPTAIQEQNSCPGVTTRLLAGRVDRVHLAFPDARAFFKRQDNVRISGNPVREFNTRLSRARARSFWGLKNRPTLLVMGGSQGAVALNRVLQASLPDILKNSDIQVLWSSGRTDYERVHHAAADGRINVLPFIKNMEMAYAACDLLVCRAGAITLAEICLWKRPSILIPYPYAAADHQAKNALSMQIAGAAQVILEKDLTAKSLTAAIMNIFSNKERRESMGRAAALLAFPDAAETIIQSVLGLVEKKAEGR